METFGGRFIPRDNLPFRRRDNSKARYDWRYNRYGVDRFPPAPIAPLAGALPFDQTNEDIALIRAFAAGLARMST